MINQQLPLVSIAIPTYNRADSFLPQVLESALQQTYKNIEIIVSDNCSTDDTDKVVNGINDSRIRYFKHEKNIGANNNFNFALKEAKGVYFLLLHDDDLIDHDFIEVCMGAVDYKTDIGLIRTGIRLVDLERKVKKELLNKVRGPSIDDFIFTWFAYETAPYLCGTLFNTKNLQSIGGFRSKHNLFQDVKAEFIMAARFGKVDIVDIKASFREHPEERTFNVKIKSWAEDALELLEVLCELASDEYKVQVRNEGMKYFSTIMYGMAGKIGESFVHRSIAYAQVYRLFDYKYIPPVIRSFFYNAYCNSGLRYIYKKVMNRA